MQKTQIIYIVYSLSKILGKNQGLFLNIILLFLAKYKIIKTQFV